MSPETVQTEILRALREVQELSGRRWSDLRSDQKPIGFLDGFDSLAGVEATVVIEEKLGCRLDIDSIFVSDDGKRALTLREISERLAKLVTAKGGRR